MSNKGYYAIRLGRLLTGTILAINLLTATAITVLAAAPRGKFKAVNSTTISGQVYNNSAPDDALNVWIFIKDKNTGEEVFSQRITAEEHSDELCGSDKDSGCHTFTLNMDWSALPCDVYLIEGYVRDNDFSSPRTYVNGNPDARQEAPAAEVRNLVPLDAFKTTGYCPRGACSEGWGRRTSTDTVAAAGHTTVVNPRVILYGSRVMINGVVYTAEDRGRAVRGNHIGIFFNTHAKTCQHGTQNAEICLVQS